MAAKHIPHRARRIPECQPQTASPTGKPANPSAAIQSKCWFGRVYFNMFQAMYCVCVCVCVRTCVCARMRMHACSEHYTCLRVYVCGRSWGGWEGERMWEWDIYIYFFYILFYFIVILNVPSWVLSPCVKGKFTFLCFVYWWIIKIYLIDLIWFT